jgi:putative tryptophan/tyrosine transport system substrate-binding protein
VTMARRQQVVDNIRKAKAFGFALCITLVVFSGLTEAQQTTKIPRIGYVALRNTPTSTIPDPAAVAFREGLREMGYVEGKNIFVEYRYAEGKSERIPGLVDELVRLKVDVLVSPNSDSIQAAKQASKTIPVVMVTTRDPVEAGFVDSLARPGGNITGLTRLTRELSGKRLELLKEVVPQLPQVGILRNMDGPGVSTSFKEYETAARRLKIQLQSLEVRGPSPDFAAAFRAASKGRVSAVITVSDGLTLSYPKQIADFAIKNRLPSMFESKVYPEAGGLASYSSNEAESYRRAATYVDKILKGAKPGDLPVEQPAKFEFVINLRTAKALNLTIPQTVLFRADKVIK